MRQRAIVIGGSLGGQFAANALRGIGSMAVDIKKLSAPGRMSARRSP